MPTLTPGEAKAFYDRFGSKQDRQSFYETAALNRLVENGSFAAAKSVFEFGCGTGRFALDLLQHHLSTGAVYRGSDISSTMVGLASARLVPYGERAAVELASGEIAIGLAEHSVDRVVSTYVLDLLSDLGVQKFLAEAKRVLRPDGLLCLVGITHGTTPFSRVVMGIWQWLFTRNPSWVGGCRPTLLAERLASTDWRVHFRAVAVSWGIASEVVIASPRGGASPRPTHFQRTHV